MINKDYLYSLKYSVSETVVLEEGSFFLYAIDEDERSTYCVNNWAKHNPSIPFWNIEEVSDDVIKINDKIISLHSSNTINNFFLQSGYNSVYIDVTAMSCRIIAPLLKASIEMKMKVFVVYVEPNGYDIPAFKCGFNQDLADAVDGVNPLPGFSKILPHNDDPMYIFLLGFEGGRLSYLLQDQQPEDSNVFPIIGVPGYVLDYPFESYWGNHHSLLRTRGWQRVKYAEANSIVDAYMELQTLTKENAVHEFVIAPIGTKPHSIAAILFAMNNRENVELLYDNPKRGLHRTFGVRQIQICCVSEMLK